MVKRLYHCTNKYCNENFLISFKQLDEINSGKREIVKCPKCEEKIPIHKSGIKYNYHWHEFEKPKEQG